VGTRSERIHFTSADNALRKLSERRAHARIPTDEPATVRVLDDWTPRLLGRVVNISESGLKVIIGALVYPGTLVQVRFKNIIAMAEVRYCIEKKAQFEIGLKVYDVVCIK
jgi:PilZ domain